MACLLQGITALQRITSKTTPLTHSCAFCWLHCRELLLSAVSHAQHRQQQALGVTVTQVSEVTSDTSERQVGLNAASSGVKQQQQVYAHHQYWTPTALARQLAEQ